MKNPVSLLPASLRTCAVDSAGDSPARVDEEIGARVLHAWRDAQAGLFAIVQFGALLIEVETWLKKRGGGFKTRGTGLKAWLSEHAPEVEYHTAMGYKYAASGLLALADKARDRPLLELMGEEPLTTEEENAAREQVREVIATSSLRLLKAAARADREKQGPKKGNQSDGKRAVPEGEREKKALEDALAEADGLSASARTASGCAARRRRTSRRSRRCARAWRTPCTRSTR